jgi:DNA polymerase III subunit gamma/tau
VQAVPDALAGDDPGAEVVVRLAALVPADETQLLYSMVLGGRAELALAPDEYSGLVMVLLRMLAFAPADERAAATSPPTPASPRTASAPARAAEAKTAQASALTPASPPASAVAVPAVAAAATSIASSAAADRWTALVQRLVDAGAIAAMVRELAFQAECVAVADDDHEQVWQLRVERENLRTPALRERLQAAAQQCEGRALRIEIEAGATVDTPAARDTAERDRRQAEAERLINEDPLVRALMAQYKTARIVPGSVKPH